MSKVVVNKFKNRICKYLSQYREKVSILAFFDGKRDDEKSKELLYKQLPNNLRLMREDRDSAQQTIANSC